MSHDLRTILNGWEYEPGRISVRKIIGRDGREKIQTRVDLGVLQFEVTGRPDGRRPHGYGSLLEYHERQLADHVHRQGGDNDFVLSSEECREIRHEAHLFYQRYLSLFVLEEFDEVERDTERNLRLIDLCRRYGATEHDRQVLEPQRAYVMMMNVRAKVYAALQRGAHEMALTQAEQGIHWLQSSEPEVRAERDGDEFPELGVLTALRLEVLEKMPLDAAPRLRWELQSAIEREDYERAAALRDRLERRASR